MNLFLKHARIVAVAMFALFLIACTEEEEPDVPAVVAAFTSSTDEATGTVTFTNASENSTSSAWDFGDNTTSTSTNPSKQYMESGDYEVVLTASNEEGDTDTATETITIAIVVSDTEVPVITLLGDAEVSIRESDPYVDAGATATDNVDGDISANIVDTADGVDTSTPGTYSVTYNVSDAAGNAATEVTRSVIVTEKVRVDSGLLTNGDFEDGTASWFTNYGDNLPEIRVDGGNAYFYAEVTNSDPDNAFAVNLSQVIEITEGEHYTLSFNASTGAGTTRTLIAGIGLNEDPWSNATETVTLTETPTDFSLDLTASSFGGTNSRVLFDMNGADGIVVIDNVKLEVDLDGGSGGSGGGTGTSIVDFENSLTGIAQGQFGGSVGAELIANPFSGGINTSANVLHISYLSTSEWWGGAELDFGKGVLDATATIYKAKLYSTVANSKVLFQVETASQVGTVGEVQTIVNANEWVEVTFTMPNPPSEVNRIIIRPDVADETTTKGNDGSLYIDDIVCESCTLGSGSSGSTGTLPSTAAPTPPARDAADVISLFSDAYTDIAVDTWSASWDDSDIADVMVEGNATKQIFFTNFIGIDFQSSRFDATSMTHLHIDFWTDNNDLTGKVFNSKFSHWGGGAGEVSAVEFNINTGTSPAIETGKWISVDLPFNSAVRSDLVQFIITCNLGEVYVDNIYIYK